MSSQPYIPLYIGDWQRDTGCLTLEAEGALLKLIFKLWDSPQRGRLSISFSRLSILLKKSVLETQNIVSELQENDVLNIEFLQDNTVKIESRRMLKEADKSLKASANGKKGGRPKKANQKLTESELKANTKRITDNDIDIESDNEIKNEKEKGGMGEKGLIAQNVIEYLNQLSGRKFLITNQLYLRRIIQRLREGYTELQLREIIEYKVAEWKGSEMEKHLQPDTLFNKEKCNKYRDQVQHAKDKGFTIHDIKPKKNGSPNEGLAERVAESYRKRGVAI
jgi:uncharacterized phage protein (TIGR02220 family)